MSVCSTREIERRRERQRERERLRSFRFLSIQNSRAKPNGNVVRVEWRRLFTLYLTFLLGFPDESGMISIFFMLVFFPSFFFSFQILFERLFSIASTRFSLLFFSSKFESPSFFFLFWFLLSYMEKELPGCKDGKSNESGGKNER